jgi:hypothetical protein
MREFFAEPNADIQLNTWLQLQKKPEPGLPGVDKINGDFITEIYHTQFIYSQKSRQHQSSTIDVSLLVM